MHVSSSNPMLARSCFVQLSSERSYAVAKQIGVGEFDFLTIAEGNQIADDLKLPRPQTEYSGIKEMIEFFCGLGIRIHGTV
jgi:hypothetical protein